MDPSTPTLAATIPVPVAVFGLDSNGRPHCSYFSGSEAESATKAAESMGMHVLPLAGPACDGLADQMPAGRIFPASGKAFVPFCKQPLYERLAALGNIPAAPPAPKTERTSKLPKAAGAKAGAEANGVAKPAKAAAAKPAAQVPAEATSVALSWQTIAAGSLVLATSGGPAEGWFESVVVEEKPDQLYVLRWRDFADESLFLRRVDQLALLPVGTPLTPTA